MPQDGCERVINTGLFVGASRALQHQQVDNHSHFIQQEDNHSHFIQQEDNHSHFIQSSAIDSRSGQIFSLDNATKPAVQ